MVVPEHLALNKQHLAAVIAEQLNPKHAHWPLPDGRTIYLLTPEMLATLPDGTEVYSILGNMAVKGRNPIDDDTRGGWLAYGLLTPLP